MEFLTCYLKQKSLSKITDKTRNLSDLKKHAI